MYFWHKKEILKDLFPPTLEHIFKETLGILRPKLKLCQSYEETQAEVNNIRSALGIGKSRFNTFEILFGRTLGAKIMSIVLSSISSFKSRESSTS